MVVVSRERDSEHEGGETRYLVEIPDEKCFLCVGRPLAVDERGLVILGLPVEAKVLVATTEFFQ